MNLPNFRLIVTPRNPYPRKKLQKYTSSSEPRHGSRTMIGSTVRRSARGLDLEVTSPRHLTMSSSRSVVLMTGRGGPRRVEASSFRNPCQFYDWYDPEFPSQANTVILGLLKKTNKQEK
uniref:Uncharacterized protein n=1 Tax=Solanum tuberosum TaxID=4113 RepID=M1DR06_SOLTU